MDGNDPHIHVETGVVHGDAAARNTPASAFGLAGDLPSRVTTGCGLRPAGAVLDDLAARGSRDLSALP
ncbi:hypothetical protein WB401_12410 [Streptomyces brasiliscabiei]|uniref:Uncharacterized protein n=1 Tax=Streptomyces brasiliscabiei TaxID=2736302 RepID=A0ABU8G4E3_9ACTN